METNDLTPDSSFGPTVRCLIKEDEVNGMQSPFDKNYTGPGGAQSLNYRAVARIPAEVQMEEMMTVTTRGDRFKDFYGIALGASDPSDYLQKRSIAVIRQGTAGISADFVVKAEGEALHPGDHLYPVSLKNGVLGLGTNSQAIKDLSSVNSLVSSAANALNQGEQESATVTNLFNELSKHVIPVAQVVACDTSSKWVKIWLYGMN